MWMCNKGSLATALNLSLDNFGLLKWVNWFRRINSKKFALIKLDLRHKTTQGADIDKVWKMEYRCYVGLHPG